MEPIIRVQGIRKVYKVGREKVVALNDINLSIYPGEVCCILGPSGSGKSTLLNQLAGLEKPTAGQVYIGKTNISRLNENQLARFRQKNIGFIFQSYNLLTALTAQENVSLPLMFRGVDRYQRDRAAAQMLRQVGLGNRLGHKPSEMSGGQQQRVGIARAFVAKPKIVFADEPTGNLDTKTTREVMEMLIKMTRENGITFILVTHNNELAEFADRIITIRDGMVVDDRTNLPAPAGAAGQEEAVPALPVQEEEAPPGAPPAAGQEEAAPEGLDPAGMLPAAGQEHPQGPGSAPQQEEPAPPSPAGEGPPPAGGALPAQEALASAGPPV